MASKQPVSAFQHTHLGVYLVGPFAAVCFFSDHVTQVGSPAFASCATNILDYHVCVWMAVTSGLPSTLL